MAYISTDFYRNFTFGASPSLPAPICIAIKSFSFSFDITMLLHKNKKNQSAKGNKLLISIAVLGSAGRLPVLGSDLNDFMLYCPYVGTDALSPWETISSQGARNFMSCKKRQPEKLVDNGGPTTPATTITRKGSGSWKVWINKSLNLKISSH
ncbi:hypothetical protein FNV43_RR14655 [Rhamnella rubrinervis]|uniref:DUF7054 domain-containing protein n=1 Tax=Rhamnella rubrinervis TaxID=2594499 RepID=A0A8K0H373_9ROSA|nr:hypothetical protein FNV43_RR14655 [Rhamnella rubrinervis]